MPKIFNDRLHVIHEGVATNEIRRRENARLILEKGQVLDTSKPVVTFINRVFEPMRGYPVFMRALPSILERVPNAHVLLIGSAGPGGYGGPPPEGGTWKAHYSRELEGRLDPDRVHYAGTLSHSDMVLALSLSAVHVYLTYPFVLSWSLLEAMACECLVVASNTAPVRDVIDGENGLLVDFFDTRVLADAVVQGCDRPAWGTTMRSAARATVVKKYDLKTVCLPAWLALIEAVSRKTI
jgi:glycosyltransferase involved in cell wall biosynthesis